MKAALLGGALAFALWGAPAFAQGTEGSSQVGQDQRIKDSKDVGGAGEAGTMEDESFQEEKPEGTEEPGVGGAGDEGMLYEEPPEPQPEPAPQQQPEPRGDIWIIEENTEVTKREEEKKTQPWERGVTVLLGGGVEGYTGQLAPQINPGPSWGVGAAFKPTRIFGVELGYSGAVNNLEGNTGPLLDEGDAAVTRHGGHAVATLGLTPTAVQPYILGGIGVDRYIVSDEARADFNNNTVGQVPVGVGLRTNIGNFTADLRGNYGILFEQEFAPEVGGTDLGDLGDRTPTGRYGASLRLGASF